MRVVLFGATGMIGKGVLLECLDSQDVASVVAVTRGPTGITHPKLVEILHDDFFDLSSVRGPLAGIDVCFFCLGVSSVGMTEEAYGRVTCGLTVSVAEELLQINPQIVLCYVSGAGTDSTEKGRTMWARVKGKTENRLMAMPFEAAYMFRPGFIQPLRGIKSKTTLYRVFYAVLSPLYPLLKRVFPSALTDTRRVGRSMIRVAIDGGGSRVLEAGEINELGA